MIDDDFIMGTDLDHINDDDHLSHSIEEVEVINSDRQILIKLHTLMIRLAIDKLQT